MAFTSCEAWPNLEGHHGRIVCHCEMSWCSKTPASLLDQFMLGVEGIFTLLEGLGVTRVKNFTITSLLLRVFWTHQFIYFRNAVIGKRNGIRK